MIAALAAVGSAKPSEVALSTASINVEPGLLRSVRQATLRVETLNSSEVQALFAAWMGVEELPYYRLRWMHGVALYKAEQACGWSYSDIADEVTDFGPVSAASSHTVDWVRLLAASVQAAEQQAA